MHQAIKVLEKRIKVLRDELEKVNKTIEEPELPFEYEFAINTAENIRCEIEVMEEAIECLVRKVTMLHTSQNS